MSEYGTKNFKLSTDPKLACTCGDSDCDKRTVRQEVLEKIQLIRDDYGRPLKITSGGRCPNHLNELTKPKAGDHQKRMAVDIRCTSALVETKLKVLAGRYGATKVAGGAYCGFVHISWVETDMRDVPTWEY